MSMRNHWPLSVLVLLTLALSGCADLLGTDTSDESSLHPEANSFITLMNDHRVEQGLSELEWDGSLADVAQAHSQDMHDRSFFSHDNPDGDSPFDRMSAAGISYQSAGENIAKGQSTGQAVFDAWINSSGHRANIENSGYTHHGLGYVEDGHYWTHVFAKNPSSD